MAVVKITIPNSWRAGTTMKPLPTISIQAKTVNEALTFLIEAEPSLTNRIFDSLGSMRRHVIVFVEGEDIRAKGGMGRALRDGDELLLVSAISGG